MALFIFTKNHFYSSSIHSIVICIEACLFGIFVITVFVDQIQSIIDDRSLIDSLKLDNESRNTPRVLPSKRVLFQNVFGSGTKKKNQNLLISFSCLGPIICWLLPCDLRSSNKINDSLDAYTV